MIDISKSLHRFLWNIIHSLKEWWYNLLLIVCVPLWCFSLFFHFFIECASACSVCVFVSNLDCTIFVREGNIEIIQNPCVMYLNWNLFEVLIQGNIHMQCETSKYKYLLMKCLFQMILDGTNKSIRIIRITHIHFMCIDCFIVSLRGSRKYIIQSRIGLIKLPLNDSYERTHLYIYWLDVAEKTSKRTREKEWQ